MEGALIEELREREISRESEAGTRGVAALVTLQLGAHGRGFTDYTLGPESGLAIGPCLVLSDFQMPQPFFPPHPHAGFSVMTYMFPDSAGAFIYRDSLGDHSRIEPGALHWSQAAAGSSTRRCPSSPARPATACKCGSTLARSTSTPAQARPTSAPPTCPSSSPRRACGCGSSRAATATSRQATTR